MNLKRLHSIILAVACLVAWSTADAVQPAPKWVQKGQKEVEKLNKKRSNETYSFLMLQQSDADEEVVELNRFKPLYEYVNDAYGVSCDNASIDSVVMDDLRKVYTVSFDRDGQPGVVYAQMVDEYTKFDTHVNGAFDYDNYQLYAISEPGVMPQYDDFNLTRRYNAATCTLMSLIPGMGQYHKGQKVRGSLFLGGELVLVAGVIYGQTAMNRRYDQAMNALNKDNNKTVYESYMSNHNTYKHLRNVCLLTGGILYVYNLLDAALSKGARYVQVERKESPTAELTFAPVVAPEMAGIGLNLRF